MSGIVPLLPKNPKQGEKFKDTINNITWIFLGNKWIDYDEFIISYKIFDSLHRTKKEVGGQ